MQKTDVPFFIAKVAIRGATFADLHTIALEQIKGLGGRAEVVCGPISTGGFGNVIANLLMFNHAIEVLAGHGRPMWSQVPFEAGLADLEHQWKKENPTAGYCMPILTEFYDPLFSPTLLRRAWFLDGPHGWKTSRGATWEHERMKERGIEVQYFPEAWHRQCVLPSGLI